jgi:RNA polymerase sigma factor for flagellar operon FliA
LEAIIESEGESASWPRHEAEQENATLQRELVEVLRNGLQDLGDRDRLLLKRYYEHDRTLKEIAEELGVTESRVCQIHSALLAKLKLWLGERMKEQPTPSMVYKKLARS